MKHNNFIILTQLTQVITQKCTSIIPEQQKIIINDTISNLSKELPKYIIVALTKLLKEQQENQIYLLSIKDSSNMTVQEEMILTRWNQSAKEVIEILENEN